MRTVRKRNNRLHNRMSVFSLLHYRSVVVGALLASSLILFNSKLSLLLMSSQDTNEMVSSGNIVAAESRSRSGPITLRPNVCPHVTSKTSAAFDRVYDKAEWGYKIQNASDFYSDAAWPPKERQSASGGGSNLGYATQVSMKVFRHWDGTKCPLPKIVSGKVERSVDLVHARDVLQHLQLEQGLQFLCHVFQSGARVFVTTTFPDKNIQEGAFSLKNGDNKNIQEGEFYLNDLTAAPFNLPAPKDDSTVTCTPTHPLNELDDTCVYDLTQPWVAAWIAEKKCDALQLRGASPS
jgi:hypothetical protein